MTLVFRNLLKVFRDLEDRAVEERERPIVEPVQGSYFKMLVFFAMKKNDTRSSPNLT